ncbi:adenosine kinase [Stappia sp. MMSF_3263]|uniref:adenosine kinase n=1 Tax=Stappia sp. MMSF_3263 TaxID=3046693 RepID=UPI00273EE4D3|nr:adenosine kinase [Stappia sp. MMSF_3263]
MTGQSFDTLCIGNAICDVFAHVEEDFLLQESLVKGSMRLIDTAEAVRLYDKMGQTTRISGGSAGNTAAGIAALGGAPAYFGKVANDELGNAYRHDMRGTGVHFETPALIEGEGPPTARSMILITPDGERTMNTYLGACVELSERDIEPETVAASALTYMEGYLWDPPEAKKAFLKAAGIAHANGRKVSLTLSDSFCVDRYRAEFLGMMRDGTIDVLFANEHELRALYETSDLDTAIAAVREDCAVTALTLGAKGAMAISRGETVQVPAAKVSDIVDLTGAGDLFAAGFLLGMSRDFDFTTSAELGCLCAAEVIGHVGARPEQSLRQLAGQQGFAL